MTKLNFLVALMTDDNDYQLEQARSAEATAVKLGIDHQILYADNDAVTQSTQLLKAIQAAPEERRANPWAEQRCRQWRERR